MRSYGQYCSVARALDVIGDRWNLLIVRELLLRGPCRYTDLLAGLPGIATNLLADRLRDLEQLGVITREQAPPPVATTLFGLTERGQALRPVLIELGRWGAPLMLERAEGSAFRSEWLGLPVELFLSDRAPERGPVTIELRTQDEVMTIAAGATGISTRKGAADDPDLVVSGAPELVIGVLGGALGIEAAQEAGLELAGDAGALERLLPPRATAGVS
jgi:DNA-binding HxlR family transcriptional regulator